MPDGPTDVFSEDRVEILEVSAFGSAATTIWPCTRCGWHHPARESWSIRLRTRNAGSERSLVVCPNCAEDLQERLER